MKIQFNHDKLNWLYSLPRPYYVIYLLTILLAIMALAYSLVNFLFFDFHGILYFPFSNIYFIPLMLLLNIIAIYGLKKEIPFSFFIWANTSYFFAYLAIGLLATSIQYTPFHYIDKVLIMIDEFLGFSSVKAIILGHSSHFIDDLLSLCYNGIRSQLILAPVIFSLAKQRRCFVTFVTCNLICFAIAASIYYFWPTVAPAHFFHNALFSPSEHNTYLKYYDVHHNIHISNFAGGMIAFPSMHVTWACLLIYAYRKIKYLFSLLTIVNLIAIAATVLLGWHYLTDLIAGIILACSVIYLVESWFSHLEKSNTASC